MRRASWILLAVGCVLLGCDDTAEPKPVEPATPATRPATAPAVEEDAAAAQPIRDYRDYLERDEPRYAELDFDAVRPVNLLDAGVVTFDRPVHLCGRGDLWITHPEAADVQEALKDAASAATHVLPIEVAYVHWTPADDGGGGGFEPTLVERLAGGGFAWHKVGEEAVAVSPAGDDAGESPYTFAEAFSRRQEVMVPTVHGAAALTRGGDPVFVRLSDEPATVRMLLDAKGVLAWAVGGDRVVRYVDGVWQDVEGDWQGGLLQLIPMLDGSITYLHEDADGNVAAAAVNVAAEAVDIDEAAVREVVRRLADPSPQVRNDAYQQLLAFGPGAHPLLRAMQDEVPVAAKVRVKTLLAERAAPLLGDMQLQPGPAQVVNWLGVNGVVLYLPNGVSVPHLAERQMNPYIAPAWVSVRPGLKIERLPPGLAFDVNPDEGEDSVRAWGPEWVVRADSRGPMRWYGNHLRPILPEEHRDVDFAGIDAAGRWLFEGDEGGTVLLDPRLPDVTPRMPTWHVDVSGGQAGWTIAGWPVMKRGGGWALDGGGWRSLDDGAAEDIVLADPPALPEGVIGLGDGGTWEGGGETLRFVASDGRAEIYELPPETHGDASAARVFEIADPPGRLLLVNTPGQVYRLKRAGGGLTLEATFTEGVPNTLDVDRLWLDPAGRLVWAYDGTQLVVAFPSGRVPPSIESMMPMREQR